MVPDFPKYVLFALDFNVYFSPTFDEYSNRITVHVCHEAKSSTVWLLSSASLMSVSALVVYKSFILPRQADS